MKHHNWWRRLSTRVRASNRIHSPSQGCIFKGRWDSIFAPLPPWGARSCPTGGFAMSLGHSLLSTSHKSTSGACYTQEQQARQGWPHCVALLLWLGSKGLIPNESGFPVKPKVSLPPRNLNDKIGAQWDNYPQLPISINSNNNILIKGERKTK